MGWPWDLSRPATTLESTPPLMATAMGRESGIGGGQLSEAGDGIDDGGDEGVDLLGSGILAEREAERRAGVGAGQAEGEQDVAGLDGAGGAGGAGGDGEAAEVEGDDEAFALDAGEAEVGDVGGAEGGVTVQAGAGDELEEGLFEVVAEGGGEKREAGGGEAEADGGGDIFGAGAAVALVVAAEGVLGQGCALADVEGADALGAIDFVGAEAEEVDAPIVDVDGDAAGGLDGVAVEEDVCFAGDAGDFADGLEGADFVVDGHEGDEAGVGAERAAEVIGIDDAGGGDGEDGEGVAEAVELFGDVEDGGVFDGGGDDVGAGGQGAEEGEVIRFGAAGGEDDLFGFGGEECGEGAAGGLELLAGLLAEGMNGGGVAEVGRVSLRHGGEDGGVDGSCGVVVEIRAHKSIIARLAAADDGGVAEAEILVDLAGGIGAVEGVEVDAFDAVVEEVAALFGGPMDADVADGLGRVLAAVEGAEEFGGEAGAEGELGHALHAGQGGDGHDAGDDGGGDAGEFAAFAEVEEVAVIEEELGADVVGAFGDFGAEVVEFVEAVGGGGVAFGKAGDTDAEAAGVGVEFAFVELADEADEIGGVLEGVVGFVVGGEVARGVAAEGEDVGDAGGGVFGKDVFDVGGLVADAGEVWDGVEGGGGLDAGDEVVGEFAGGAAGAVGNGDEGGLEGFEGGDVLKEGLGLGFGLRGKELKGEGGLIGRQNIANVHQ